MYDLKLREEKELKEDEEDESEIVKSFSISAKEWLLFRANPLKIAKALTANTFEEGVKYINSEIEIGRIEQEREREKWLEQRLLIE
jgi:hypothetical protein